MFCYMYTMIACVFVIMVHFVVCDLGTYRLSYGRFSILGMPTRVDNTIIIILGGIYENIVSFTNSDR